MKYSPLQLLFPGLVVVATIISYSVFVDQDAPVVGDSNAALVVNRAAAKTADFPSSLSYQADHVPAQSNGTEIASTQTNDPLKRRSRQTQQI